MSLFIHVPRAGLPCVTDPERASRAMAELRERSLASSDPDLVEWVRAIADDPAGRRLLEAIFSNSPFLTACALADIPLLMQVLTRGPDSTFGRMIDRIKDKFGKEPAQDRLMRELRQCRRHAALVAAIADITGHWPLERVTHALSDFADAALSATISHLLRGAAENGDIVLADEHFPEDGCGYVALAMGKYGARELNYSSDIDLIILYDPVKVDCRAARGLQHSFLRLSRQLVGILDQHTEDGYVFRVDLRLRPDPSSTPIAIPCAAAQSYYATRGELWERAAMIKARPVAGDIALGRRFLSELSPFIWRDQMDFSMIRDLQSIKKRINAHRGSGEIGFLGHNIKLGRGGIREIEFFAQTHQLIYGGSDPYLRCQRTVDALTTLTEAGWIDDRVADELTEAYEFLRQLEHRLQMVDDQQTQTLPSDAGELRRIAGFMGFEDGDDFRDTLLHHLHRVAGHYTGFFGDSSPPAGAPSWTPASAAATDQALETLRHAGFKDADGALHRLQAWHKGSLCTAGDERSRAASVELIPAAIEAAGRTGDPDRTLESLDGFLAGLDKDHRCFSLLSANPRVIDLLADIVAAAPAFAARLSHEPEQLQAALSPDFFSLLPDRRLFMAELAELVRLPDLQAAIDRAAAWANARRFQIAVNILRHRIDSSEAGRALCGVADAIVRSFAARLADQVTVLAFGPYGTGDLATGSALGLLILHESGDDPAAARQLATVLSAPAKNDPLCKAIGGACPWSKAGPLVASLDAFADQASLDFQPLLALSQARLVFGSPTGRASEMVRGLVTARHDMPRLAEAAREARRAAVEAGATDAIVEPRRCPGGLDELELTVRLHQWRHAAQLPTVLGASLPDALATLASQSLVPEPLVKRLLAAHRLLRQLDCAVGIATDGPVRRDQLPAPVLSLLARAGGAKTLQQLEDAVADATAMVGEAFRAAAGD
jgi:[glutamine synthetase] adenylyltransferase / [glutamine synthetase]-adenylyl-L-tyrosine phosphorylase